MKKEKSIGLNCVGSSIHDIAQWKAVAQAMTGMYLFLDQKIPKHEACKYINV